MELVYLWVEEYKNIKNQGFNFSPRFDCQYDKKTNELTINENKDYINIFPENINVTAIVGKNGSGKSNLIELINDQAYENPLINPYPITNTFLVRIIYDYNDNSFYIERKNVDLVINNKSSVNMKNQNKNHFNKIVIKPTPAHSQREYLTLLNFFIKKDPIFPFSIPKFVNIGIHDNVFDVIDTIKDEDIDFSIYYNPFEDDIEKRLKIFHILLILTYLKNYAIEFDTKVSKSYEHTILELEKKIDLDIKIKINNFINEIKYNLETFSQNPYHYIDIKNLSDDFFEIYINLIKRKNKDSLLNFKGLNVFIFNLYPQMSDGQYQFTYLFNSIFSEIKDEKILLLIDEGENYLHPNWQKKYLSYILKFLNDNFPNKYFHIILTTHSPFLLSDLAQENIIYLDTDKKYNCIVTNGLKNNKQTFAANIHTLLSDSFFMKDGLMGEFAKEKINGIINFHERVEKNKTNKSELKKLKNEYLNIDISNKTKKDRYWKVHSIIGDDYLKHVIKNHLVEIEKILLGKDEAKKEEIKRLNEQIKLLEQE